MPLAGTGAMVSPMAPVVADNRSRCRCHCHCCCLDRKDCRNRNRRWNRNPDQYRRWNRNRDRNRSQNPHQNRSQHRNQYQSQHRSHCSQSVDPVPSSCNHRRSGHCRAVDHPGRRSDSAAGTGSDSCCPTGCWDRRWDACRPEQWAEVCGERAIANCGDFAARTLANSLGYIQIQFGNGMVTELIGRVAGLVAFAIGTGKRVGTAHHERFVILQFAHAAHLDAVLGLQSVEDLGEEITY